MWTTGITDTTGTTYGTGEGQYLPESQRNQLLRQILRPTVGGEAVATKLRKRKVIEAEKPKPKGKATFTKPKDKKGKIDDLLGDKDKPKQDLKPIVEDIGKPSTKYSSSETVVGMGTKVSIFLGYIFLITSVVLNVFMLILFQGYRNKLKTLKTALTRFYCDKQKYTGCNLDTIVNEETTRQKSAMQKLLRNIANI